MQVGRRDGDVAKARRAKPARACARIGRAAGDAQGGARGVEHAVAEVRTGVTARATRVADEQPQPAQRVGRVLARRRVVCARHRVAKPVERRRAGGERLDEGGDRARDVHEDRRVVGVFDRAELALVAAGDVLVQSDAARDQPRARIHLVGLEQRPARRPPEAVGGPAPAEARPQAQVRQRGRVPARRSDRLRARPQVGPGAVGLVAARASHVAVAREHRIEEQPLPERDRPPVARQGIVAIPRRRGGPRAVRQQPLRLVGAEVWRVRRGRVGAQRDQCEGARVHRPRGAAGLHASDDATAPRRWRSRARGTRVSRTCGRPRSPCRRWAGCRAQRAPPRRAAWSRRGSSPPRARRAPRALRPPRSEASSRRRPSGR